MDVQLFDTTLRDGTQSEGLSLSVEDKLKISRLLDGFGIHFIEGGYPGSNPKDIEFFRRARALRLKHAKLTAFGSTRKAGAPAADDANLRALVDADTPAVCIFGKSWLLHVTKVLGTTAEENLAMIADSVRFLKAAGRNTYSWTWSIEESRLARAIDQARDWLTRTKGDPAGVQMTAAPIRWHTYRFS